MSSLTFEASYGSGISFYIKFYYKSRLKFISCFDIQSFNVEITFLHESPNYYKTLDFDHAKSFSSNGQKNVVDGALKC